jgi:hypothetical protein
MLLNAALYGAFAIWCTFAPDRTARTLGFADLSPPARSEYLTIYGGLQAGLALAFLAFGLIPQWHGAGAAFAVLLYAPIAIYRATTMLRLRIRNRATLVVGALEGTLLVIAIVVWWRYSLPS